MIQTKQRMFKSFKLVNKKFRVSDEQCILHKVDSRYMRYMYSIKQVIKMRILMTQLSFSQI